MERLGSSASGIRHPPLSTHKGEQ
ncbi:uncharacterized protein G2W53_038011 [Senna tora]|uniref:Uncharacterized protein n=1 Tax=Senna tora TaxID=362788 RepID=A0A834W1N8_9FABA|nr:uncharacterized protein G2W53_038011 [Senna tora]